MTPTKSGLILLNFFSSISKKLKIPLSVWIRMTLLFNLSTNKPLLYTNLAVRIIKNWTRKRILRKDHFLTFWPLFDTQGTLFSLRTKFFSDLQALMNMFCYILGIFIHRWMSYASYRVKGALFVTPRNQVSNVSIFPALRAKNDKSHYLCGSLWLSWSVWVLISHSFIQM